MGDTRFVATDGTEGCAGGCREDLIGIIIVKELILVDKDAGARVGDLKLRSAPQLKSDTRLYDMLRLFETGRCHLAVLVQAPGKPVVAGICTIWLA